MGGRGCSKSKWRGDEGTRRNRQEEEAAEKLGDEF